MMLERYQATNLDQRSFMVAQASGSDAVLGDGWARV